MSRFNIAFVGKHPFNPYMGGVERVTDILAKEFIRRGYNVWYLCETAPEPTSCQYNYPVELIILPEVGGFRNSINIEAYKRFLCDKKIDIVVNQQGYAPVMNNVLRLAKTISVVHTSEDGLVKMDMSYSRMLRCDKSVAGLLKWLLKICGYPIYIYYKRFILEKGLKAHYRALANDSAAVFMLSDSDCIAFEKRISPIKANTFTVINPSGTEQEPFSTFHKEKIILYVGRIDSVIKKPIRLLKIWKMLCSKHEDWRLIFVGEGDQLQKMRDYVERNKLQNVSFDGHQKELLDYYRRASFICLTSESEGFGMALVEGMTYGCIPVTFGNVGIAERIIDGQDGVLVPEHNLSTYRNRLEELMDNEEKRRRLSYNAFLKSQQFSVDIIVNQWEKIFDSIMAN